MGIGLAASSLCHGLCVRDHSQFKECFRTVFPFTRILWLFLELIRVSACAYTYVHLFILKCDLSV